MKQNSSNSNELQIRRRYLNLLEKEKHYLIINDFSLNIMYLNSEDEVSWFIAQNVISKMNFEDCVV